MESGGERRLACAASVDLFGQSKMNVRQELSVTENNVTRKFLKRIKSGKAQPEKDQI